MKDVITALAGIFVFFAVLGYFFQIIYRLPYQIIKYRQRVVRRNEKHGKSHKFWTITLAVIFDPVLIFAIMYISFGFLGIFANPFFFGFHLLAIVTRSADMRNIMKAIQKSSKESLLILLLFFIAELLFALAAFSSYHNDVPNNLCVSLLTCILTYIDQTFKVNYALSLE